MHWGGLRSPYKAVARVKGLQEVGERLRKILEDAVDNNVEAFTTAMQSIGDPEAQGLPPQVVDEVQRTIEEASRAHMPAAVAEPPEGLLRGDLLSALATAAGDPEKSAQEWVTHATMSSQWPRQGNRAVWMT